MRKSIRKNSWNRFLGVLAVLVLIACGGPKPIAIGSLEPMAIPDLVDSLETHRLDFEHMRFVGSGRVVQDGSSKGFKFDFRVQKDTLLWLDLSDPLFGLKVARGFLVADSVSFLDRLNGEYFAGDMRTLQNMVQSKIDFELLYNALTGQPFRILDPKGNYDLSGENSYELYYFPENDPAFSESKPSFYFEASGTKKHLISQMLSDGMRRVEAYYSDFVLTPKGYRPSTIEFKIIAETSIELTLNIKEYTFRSQQKYPFNIPSSYAPME